MQKKVGTEEQWKAEGAMGLVMKGQGVQAIYGPKADVLKSDIQDILDSGEVIPETLPSQNGSNSKRYCCLQRCN